jgi:hypothetical protein
VLARMMEGLDPEGSERKTLMMDATYLSALPNSVEPRDRKEGQMTSKDSLAGAQRAG